MTGEQSCNISKRNKLQGTPYDELLSNLGFNDNYQGVFRSDHLSETLMSNRGKNLSSKLEVRRATREYIVE